MKTHSSEKSIVGVPNLFLLGDIKVEYPINVSTNPTAVCSKLHHIFNGDYCHLGPWHCLIIRLAHIWVVNNFMNINTVDKRAPKDKQRIELNFFEGLESKELLVIYSTFSIINKIG